MLCLVLFWGKNAKIEGKQYWEVFIREINQIHLSPAFHSSASHQMGPGPALTLDQLICAIDSLNPSALPSRSWCCGLGSFLECVFCKQHPFHTPVQGWSLVLSPAAPQLLQRGCQDGFSFPAEQGFMWGYNLPVAGIIPCHGVSFRCHPTDTQPLGEHCSLWVCHLHVAAPMGKPDPPDNCWSTLELCWGNNSCLKISILLWCFPV